MCHRAQYDSSETPAENIHAFRTALEDYGKYPIDLELDAILEKHDAVRPLGPHCYEMYGGERFAKALREEPGTYFLTDFLIRAWQKLVVEGLKLDRHPKLKDMMFRHYRRLVYYSREKNDALGDAARAIARFLELPLVVEHVGYGDLERRLVAIMEERAQPVTEITLDSYSHTSYPVATPPPVGEPNGAS